MVVCLGQMRAQSMLAAVLAMSVTLLASAPIVAADTCNLAFDKLRASRAKGVIPGKTFTFSGSLQNTGGNRLDHLYLKIEMPEYLVPVKAMASKAASWEAPGTLVQESSVVFRKLVLPFRRKLKFKVIIGTKSCRPSGAVEIQGIAYRLDDADQITCTKLMTPYSVYVVRSAKGWTGRKQAKHASWDDGDCTTPTPAPSSDFEVVGQNTRCLEAKLLGSRRRHLAVATEMKKKPEELQRRELPTYTADQCYEACGGYLGVPAPYYLNVDASGNCYCCETCRRVYDPNFTVIFTMCFVWELN